MPFYARAHQQIDHVWSEDPALDASKPEAFLKALEESRRTGDLTKLPYKEGQKPVIFRLRSLTHAQKLAVGDALNSALVRMEATGAKDALLLYRACSELVAVGLVDVVGVEGFKLEFDGEGASKRVSAESMEALSYDSLIIELGMRIRTISSPDPTRGQA